MFRLRLGIVRAAAVAAGVWFGGAAGAEEYLPPVEPAAPMALPEVIEKPAPGAAAAVPPPAPPSATVECECKSVFDWKKFFFSSRRRHTRFDCDWSSDVCSSD